MSLKYIIDSCKWLYIIIKHVLIFPSFICLVWFGFMVFNATFNNISVISWQSVLLVEETGLPGENHWPVACHWQTLSHNAVHLTLIEIRTHNATSVVISTDCIGSCKSNYHTITATMPPRLFVSCCDMAQCAPPFILKLVKDVVYFKRYTNLQVDAVSPKWKQIY